MSPVEFTLPPGMADPSAGWLAGEQARLLATAAAARSPEGGFGWLGDDGRIDPAQSRPLWITARMTHCFSLAVLLDPANPEAAALADHGLAAIAGPFHDRVHGGWFAALPPTESGPIDSGPKGAYEHAFVLLAAAGATIAGRPQAPKLLAAAIDIIEDHFWDDVSGALVEQWDRGWTVCEAYRGANANMHAIEAFLATADATGDPVWRRRAARIAERLINEHARGNHWRVVEHFDTQWQPTPQYNRDQPDHPFRPYGVTPGHGLEWSRLLLQLEAAQSTGTTAADPVLDWLRPAAIELFDRAVADGWSAEGGTGFCYTTDFDGRPVVRERFHWVICEAIAAAAVAHRVSGEERFAQLYRQFWQYARTTFVPATGLGWLHEATPEGQPSARTWHGRPDVYHALQATLLPRLPVAGSLAGALVTPSRGAAESLPGRQGAT